MATKLLGIWMHTYIVWSQLLKKGGLFGISFAYGHCKNNHRSTDGALN